MSGWRRGARAVLVVVVLLGAVWGLLRWTGWLDIDLGDLEPTAEDLARTEALAADPVMGFTPAGWTDKFDRVALRPSLADFGNDSNRVSRQFDVKESSGNTAADLLVIADIVAQLGWGEFFADCRFIDSESAVSLVFTGIKLVRGVEAQVGVQIRERTTANELPGGSITISTPNERSEDRKYSQGRVADMSCLKAAAQQPG